MSSRLIAFSTLICLFTLTASAATITSAQSGNWSTAATWTGNVVPSAGDFVIVTAGLTVTIDNAQAVCAGIQLGGSTSGAGRGTITFGAGTQLAVAGAVTVGAANNQGSIIMSSGGTLVCDGFILNGVATWTPGTGTVQLTASNTLPNNGITDFNVLTIVGGTTTLNANLTVTGNFTINPGAAVDCGLRTLTVGANWINDGTFTGGGGSVIFNRNGNQTITGSGVNNFNLLRVNMGTTLANTLEVLSTNFSAPDGFLTLSNGTFKVSGNFTFANTFVLGPLYNIQPSAGLWLNNPNVTVTPQAGGVSVRGLLRVTAGAFNIGTAADHNLDYVAGSSIIIEGGSVTIAGHLGRNSPASTTSYAQSGGTVTVVTQGSTDITNAGFDLGMPGSSFTMSGGSLVVANATSNASDYMNASSASSVTGGTLQIGNAGTQNSQIIRIQSTVPVGNLAMSNAASQPVPPTARLVNSSLTVNGGVSIGTGTTLDANGLNLTVGGDWSNSGSFIAGPTVAFNGSGAQALAATATQNFNAVTLAKNGGALTLGASLNVNGAFSLTKGDVFVNNSTLTLNSTVTQGTGTLSGTAAGTVVYDQATAGQSVLAGRYGNLTFSNAAKTLPATDTIHVAGVFTPGSGSGHVVTGSTVDFTGASQTIPPFSYNALVLSGSGIRTASAPIVVNGNFLNASGSTFSDAATLTLSGAADVNNGTMSVGTLSLGNGGTFTNNGVLASATALTGAGNFTQGGTGSLTLGGTVDVTGFTASAVNNSVTYAGNGQSVRSVTYHHLALSGSGSPTIAGSVINGNLTLSGTVVLAATAGVTVGGDIAIGSGSTFNAGSFTHALHGNWSTTGTFIAGTSTVVFNGAAPQTLGGASFSGLTIDNPAGVSLNGDASAAGQLTLTNGAFGIASHSLTLNGALSTGSGSLVGGSTSILHVGGTAAALTLPSITLRDLSLDRPSGLALGGNLVVEDTVSLVNGTVTTGANTLTLGANGFIAENPGQPVVGTITTTRTISATSGIASFGHTGAEIILHGVAPGSTIVTRKTGVASTGSGKNSILRSFDITPATNAGLNADLVFHYDQTELNAQTAGALELYRSRDNGATWNDLGGSVDAVAQTVTVTGLNDFSRWTASDTTHRLGGSATAQLTSMSPTTKVAGDSGFILTVHGSEFVNGKSVVFVNGKSRVTTYVSSSQLNAALLAADVLQVGSFPVTVVTAGAGPSAALTLTVTPGAAASIGVETASDGSGSTIPAGAIASGSSMTGYAISRDALHNFVGNIQASAWNLVAPSGGIVAGDLKPAVDGKSAVFTARLVGTAKIAAVSGQLVQNASGTLTVVPGSPRFARVETVSDGSGDVVPAESLKVGSSLTVYLVTRDSLLNFARNGAADSWTLANVTGGVVAGDLVASADSKSATFTAHGTGSARISAASGSLTGVSSGVLTVAIIAGVPPATVPVTTALLQNYPNPFNPSTIVSFTLSAPGNVRLVVYDLIGREVAVLANGVMQVGTHEVRFDATGIATGVYLYKLTAGQYVQTRKMILVR